MLKKPLYTSIVVAIILMGTTIGVGMADGNRQLQKTEPEVKYLVMTEIEVEKYLMEKHEIEQATSLKVVEEESQPVWLRDVPLSEDIQEFLYNKTQEYCIDYDLILGLIWKESTFRINVISKTNDYGLMQINKSNQKWVNEMAGRKLNLLNAEDNIVAGLLILNSYKQSWIGKVEESKLMQYTLNSYNMGRAGYVRAGCPSRNYDRSIVAKAIEIKNQVNQ